MHTSLGVTAEVTLRLYLVRTVSDRSKNSLGVTSAVTPRGVCTVLVAGLTSVEYLERTVISAKMAKMPKMAKKCPKTQKKHDF